MGERETASYTYSHTCNETNRIIYHTNQTAESAPLSRCFNCIVCVCALSSWKRKQNSCSCIFSTIQPSLIIVNNHHHDHDLQKHRLRGYEIEREPWSKLLNELEREPTYDAGYVIIIIECIKASGDRRPKKRYHTKPKPTKHPAKAHITETETEQRQESTQETSTRNTELNLNANATRLDLHLKSSVLSRRNRTVFIRRLSSSCVLCICFIFLITKSTNRILLFILSKLSNISPYRGNVLFRIYISYLTVVVRLS